MDCNTCNKLSSTNIVGTASTDEPYKYKCKKNKFPSIPASNTSLGKSFNDGKYEYYTKSQLDHFISLNRKKLCLAKLNITNSNIISSTALLLSLLSAIINYSTNKNNNDTLNNKIVLDSVHFENRIRILHDSLNLLNPNILINKNNYIDKLQGIINRTMSNEGKSDKIENNE